MASQPMNNLDGLHFAPINGAAVTNGHMEWPPDLRHPPPPFNNGSHHSREQPQPAPPGLPSNGTQHQHGRTNHRNGHDNSSRREKRNRSREHRQGGRRSRSPTDRNHHSAAYSTQHGYHGGHRAPHSLHSHSRRDYDVSPRRRTSRESHEFSLIQPTIPFIDDIKKENEELKAVLSREMREKVRMESAHKAEIGALKCQLAEEKAKREELEKGAVAHTASTRGTEEAHSRLFETSAKLISARSDNSALKQQLISLRDQLSKAQSAAAAPPSTDPVAMQEWKNETENRMEASFTFRYDVQIDGLKRQHERELLELERKISALCEEKSALEQANDGLRAENFELVRTKGQLSKANGELAVARIRAAQQAKLATREVEKLSELLNNPQPIDPNGPSMSHDHDA